MKVRVFGTLRSAVGDRKEVEVQVGGRACPAICSGSAVRSGLRPMVKGNPGLGHSLRQPRSQRGTISILKGPHALQVEEGDPVAFLQRMIEVGLKARHGAEPAVDEGDATLLGGQGQTFEKVAQDASRGHF